MMRMGLIGTGNWACAVHGPSVVAHPDAELVGVWGRDAGRTAAAAARLGARPFADLDELFASVDGLTFAVPPDVQPAIAIRAAERHLHLLLEKPIALSVADATRLEQAVADAQVASIVFFTRRFRPETRAWLERAAELGGWYNGRAETDFNLSGRARSDVSPWRRDHGALWDMGPHALALLIPVLGDVTAVMALAGHGDQVHLLLRHGDRRSSSASLSYSSPAVAGNSLYIDGETGRLPAPMAALSTADSIAAHHVALDTLIGWSRQSAPSDPCDVHFGARVVEVLAAARESLATGRRIEIAQPRQRPGAHASSGPESD
jgi:predicted dehydrogenase